jgi:hypothetical protein
MLKKDSADRLMPPQTAGMSYYSVAAEIASFCADLLVKLRDFNRRCSLAIPADNGSECAPVVRGGA